MRIWMLLAILAATLSTGAQTTTYLDYNWKSTEPGTARFVRRELKTDSGFEVVDFFLNPVRPQMRGRYADAEHKVADGLFEHFYADGKPEVRGRYVKGLREGICLSWHANGMMSDSGLWQAGKRVGIHYQWHSNGLMADSLTVNDNGKAVSVHWDFQGNLVRAGRLNEKGEREGRWVVHHPNGKAAATLLYRNGALSDSAYFDENGKPLPPQAGEQVEADFPGGLNKWRDYLMSKLVWPPNVKLANTDVVTVVVNFVVGEDGAVRDAYVSVPFDKLFDELALKIIRRSPKWLPARQHGVAVPFRQRQAVVFSQMEE